LNLVCDEWLLSFAFNFNMRRYSQGTAQATNKALPTQAMNLKCPITAKRVDTEVEAGLTP
jgi:hypothetical protein